MNAVETEADKQTSELVGLAQRELHGDTVLSDDAGFSRLQLRMAQPARGWARGWVAGVAALGSAAVLAGALVFVHSAPGKLSFEVAGGALDASGSVVGQEHTQIRFSDGSEATLERGAEARIANITERGADVMLSHGGMHLHIAKKPQASWKVAAGPYDVRVTGTAFDVSWSNQAQAFDLRMETGAVIVTGPLAVSGIMLRAGQHLFGGVAEGRLTVEGGSSVAVASPTRALAALEPTEPGPGPAAPESAVPAPLAPTSPAPHASSEAHAWTRQVAQGHFNAVLDEAEQRGLDRTLAGGSLEELAALADAARYAGRSGVAKRVLLAERQRFPNTGPARDGAFFLGRIAEEGGGGAIEWYERYVSESPRGAYASQAFGRKMMLLYKQRGPSAAGPIAAEYLSRYPNGPYAAAARKIDQESPSAPKP
jgi:FecR protein